jgi:hypothetical protein
MPARKTQAIKASRPAEDARARQARAWLLALGVVLVAAGAGTESSATVLGCDKPNADPQYCHNKERRPVCLANGHMVWKDTQTPISQGELSFLAMDGRVPTPKCP